MRSSGLAILGILAAGTAAGLGGVTLVTAQCIDSRMVRTRAQKLLAPEELKTMRPANGEFCPDTYVFKRNGEDQCISAGIDWIGSCG
jgi:hypothetical protein